MKAIILYTLFLFALVTNSYSQVLVPGNSLHNCCNDFQLSITYCSSCSYDSLVGTGKITLPGAKVVGFVEFNGVKVTYDAGYRWVSEYVYGTYSDTIKLTPELNSNKIIYAIADSFRFNRSNTHIQISEILIPSLSLNIASPDSLVSIKTTPTWIDIRDDITYLGKVNIVDTGILCTLSTALDSMYIRTDSYIYIRRNNGFFYSMDMDFKVLDGYSWSATEENSVNYFSNNANPVICDWDTLGRLIADYSIIDYSNTQSHDTLADSTQGLFLKKPKIVFSNHSYPFSSGETEFSDSNYFNKFSLIESGLTGLSDTMFCDGFEAIIEEMFLSKSQIDSIFGQIKIPYISETSYYKFNYKTNVGLVLDEKLEGFEFPAMREPKLLNLGIWVADTLYQGSIINNVVTISVPYYNLQDSYKLDFQIIGNQLTSNYENIVKNISEVPFFEDQAQIQVKYNKSPYTETNDYNVRINTIGSSNINSNEQIDFSIFPSITNKNLYIKCNGISEYPVNITIRDIQGVILDEYTIISQSKSVDISHLIPGIYIVNASLGKKNLLNQKIIKL